MAPKTLFISSKIKKVVIDAGHGGNDPGTIGRTGLKEKDVNLDIVKRLAKLLRDSGVEVVLTRSYDVFVPLAGRVDIANNSRADLFISIHGNANRVRGLNGFEVYYVTPANNNDIKRALAAAKSAAPVIPGSSFDYISADTKTILWDMLYTFNRSESIKLGRSLCRTVNRDLYCKILGVKAANYYVLKGTRMPGVLIETGFLSNRDEERQLKNPYYRQQIVEAIMRGIVNYVSDYRLAEAP
jgi:N-acetylmuramoyl-L-alanine amidase